MADIGGYVDYLVELGALALMLIGVSAVTGRYFGVDFIMQLPGFLVDLTYLGGLVGVVDKALYWATGDGLMDM